MKGLETAVLIDNLLTDFAVKRSKLFMVKVCFHSCHYGIAVCSGKLKSPKWKNFKGIQVGRKDKIRLNNLIWREWHMQCNCVYF